MGTSSESFLSAIKYAKRSADERLAMYAKSGFFDFCGAIFGFRWFESKQWGKQMYQIGFSLSETFRKGLTFGFLRVNIWTNRMLSISEFYGLEFSERTKKPPGTDRGRNSANVPFQVRQHPTRPKISDPSGKNSITYFTAFFNGFMKILLNFPRR